MKPGKYVAILAESEDGTASVTFYPEDQWEAASILGVSMSALPFVEYTEAINVIVRHDGKLEMKVNVSG